MLELYLRYQNRPEALNREQYPVFEEFVRDCALECSEGVRAIDLDKYNYWLKQYCLEEELEL